MPNGTSGNDHLIGTESGETFDVSQGGRDSVSTLGGDDTVLFGATLTGRDHADGGNGNDILTLNGDYSAGLRFRDTTMQNFEQLTLQGAFSYHLRLTDANVADGFFVQGSAISGGSLFLDCSEVTAQLAIDGSSGSDVIKAGAGGDFLSVYQGGTDAVYGGGGNDTAEFGLNYFEDYFDGGDGIDLLWVHQSFGPIHLGAAYVANVEQFTFQDSAYRIVAHDSAVAAGQTAQVTIFNNLDAVFIGRRESDGNFNISVIDTGDVILRGGRGNDTLGCSFGTQNSFSGRHGNDTVDHLDADAALTIDLAISGAQTVAAGITNSYDNIENILGSRQADTIYGDDHANILSGRGGVDHIYGRAGTDLLSGSDGADVLYGGAGSDGFRYPTVTFSTGVTHDTVGDFNGRKDFIVSTVAITGVDFVTSGSLSSATFDSDLAAALAGNTGTFHAVLFTADAGDLAGTTLLVIDVNGSAGYEAGLDFVIDLDNAQHLDAVTTASFELF